MPPLISRMVTCRACRVCLCQLQWHHCFGVQHRMPHAGNLTRKRSWLEPSAASVAAQLYCGSICNRGYVIPQKKPGPSVGQPKVCPTLMVAAMARAGVM